MSQRYWTASSAASTPGWTPTSPSGSSASWAAARARGTTPGRADGAASAPRLQYFSLALAIPLSAIGGGTNGLPGLITAWLGIVGVNVAHSLTETAAKRREERLAAGRGRDGWD